MSSPIGLADTLGPAFTRTVAADFISTGLLGPVYVSGRGDLVATAEVDRLAAAGAVDFAALAADPITSRGIFVARCGPPTLRGDGTRMGVDVSDSWPDRVQATAGRWQVGADTRRQLRDIIAEQDFAPMVVMVKSWPAWGFEITDVPTQRGAITLSVRPAGDWYDRHIADRWMPLGRGSTALLADPSAFV